jgi:MFS transporter, DHA1 family, tetracycline resistance protein
MALIGAAFGLGFTFGPLLGAVALLAGGDAATSPWPGLAAATLSGTAFLLALWRLPETHTRDAAPAVAAPYLDLPALRATLRVPSIPLLLGASFLGIFALANFEATASLSMKSLLEPSVPPERLGQQILLTFAYIGLVQALVQGLLVRRLALTLSETVLSVTGTLLAIAGYLLLALAMTFGQGMALFLVASTVTVSGVAFVAPAVQSLLSRRADPERLGGVLGVNESLSSLARITAKGSGILLFFAQPSIPFWMATALMTLTLFLVVAAIRRGHDWDETVKSAVREERDPTQNEALAHAFR